MVSRGDVLRVKVRIARVMKLSAREGRVVEHLKGCGEEWVRYAPGAIHVGELKAAIGTALHLDPSFFDVVVEHDDNEVLAGTVVHKDSQGVIARWGTMSPHRRRCDDKGKPV